MPCLQVVQGGAGTTQSAIASSCRLVGLGHFGGAEAGQSAGPEQAGVAEHLDRTRPAAPQQTSLHASLSIMHACMAPALSGAASVGASCHALAPPALPQSKWEDADVAWDIIRKGPEPLRSQACLGEGVPRSALPGTPSLRCRHSTRARVVFPPSTLPTLPACLSLSLLACSPICRPPPPPPSVPPVLHRLLHGAQPAVHAQPGGGARLPGPLLLSLPGRHGRAGGEPAA